MNVTQEREKTNDGDESESGDESADQASTQKTNAGRILTAKDWILPGIKLEEEL